MTIAAGSPPNPQLPRTAEGAKRGGLPDTSIMAANDALPVLVVDGANFSDLDGFAREFSMLLHGHTWRGNLDAFNDVHVEVSGRPRAGGC
jgi:hypothetical protein